MAVTFPQMGTLNIPVKAFLEGIGQEVVLPPPSSKRTIELGVKYSPEFACLPLKINIGNYIEAWERGADTVVMAGGVGPCRFGYYAQVQREILQDLGCDMEMIVLEPPDCDWKDLKHQYRRLTQGRISAAQLVKTLQLVWKKLNAVDEIEKLALKYHPYEINRGDTKKAFHQILKWIEEAKCSKEVKEVLRAGKKKIDRIEKNLQRRPLRIGLVGEIYMLLEPFASLNIQWSLGNLGAEVSKSIYLSDWVKEHLIFNSLRLKRSGSLQNLAKPYLNYFVGGHGLETIGHTVMYANEGYDGIIQLMPFTCMPEIVAKSILPQVSKEKEIPVLSLVLDEQSGEAGVATRLEAFLDLIARRKAQQEGELVWMSI